MFHVLWDCRTKIVFGSRYRWTRERKGKGERKIVTKRARPNSWIAIALARPVTRSVSEPRALAITMCYDRNDWHTNDSNVSRDPLLVNVIARALYSPVEKLQLNWTRSSTLENLEISNENTMVALMIIFLSVGSITLRKRLRETDKTTNGMTVGQIFLYATRSLWKRREASESNQLTYTSAISEPKSRSNYHSKFTRFAREHIGI